MLQTDFIQISEIGFIFLFYRTTNTVKYFYSFTTNFDGVVQWQCVFALCTCIKYTYYPFLVLFSVYYDSTIFKNYHEVSGISYLHE